MKLLFVPACINEQNQPMPLKTHRGPAGTISTMSARFLPLKRHSRFKIRWNANRKLIHPQP